MTAARSALPDVALRFRRAVNMTSQELTAWLQVRDAGENDENREPLPREVAEDRLRPVA